MEEKFESLRKINLKLNPSKCSFGEREGKFLGYYVTEQGIQANPKKITVIGNMTAPKTVKEVQSLTGKIAALTRFLSKAAERQLPFFRTLKGCLKQKNFVWTEEADKAFQETKQFLATLPTFIAPVDGEILYLYISIVNEAFSSVLVAERNKVQKPVYFVSKALAGISGRLPKWAIELGAFEIAYLPRTSVKGQVFSDYLADMTGQLEVIHERTPSGEEHTYALRFNFDVTNNETEYEALLAGLNVARKMNILQFRAYVDSQLVENQFNGSFEAPELSIQKYLKLLQEAAEKFEFFELTQVSRSQNKKADALKEVQPNWMDPIMHYLCKNTLPEDKKEARLVRERSPMYVIKNDMLYRKSYLGPLMRCVGPAEAATIIEEVHNGSCALHSERRLMAVIRETNNKQQIAKYYNKKVRALAFDIGEWVLRNNEASRAEKLGKLGPNWEGPYQIVGINAVGSYKIQDNEGRHIPNTWHATLLKRYYM
ncbi:uncharacterized protein [Rutidosis leptorrhynchoides]|uniref:uncharacterized protein n=1 Tax=Rutidosis leptorrhynchoides TaxID=125765 RepID=UPI003A99C1FE